MWMHVKNFSKCQRNFLIPIFTNGADKIIQARLLFHIKIWCGCPTRAFLINLCRLNCCIKYLPHLHIQRLNISHKLTLIDTQLCGIMMSGCRKEWAYQYDAYISGVATNIDILLEN